MEGRNRYFLAAVEQLSADNLANMGESKVRREVDDSECEEVEKEDRDNRHDNDPNTGSEFGDDSNKVDKKCDGQLANKKDSGDKDNSDLL